MPTNRVNAKAFRQDDDRLFVAIQDNDQDDPQFQSFEMTVSTAMTLEEMGQIALDQALKPMPDPLFDGTLEMVWHQETDPETGSTRRVLDNIIRIA